MARTVEEIFDFLGDKKNIAKTFKQMALGYVTWNQVDKDVRSMELSDVEMYESFINDGIAEAKQTSKQILEELDFDFQDAMIGESDPEKRESLNKAYQEKRKIIIDGIDMIEQSSSKTLDNWRRFKQGEHLKYEDVYGIVDDYESKAQNSVDDRNDVGDRTEQDEPDNLVADEEISDLSDNDSETLITLLRELKQTSSDLRKAEKALRRQKFREFETEIAESGSLYLDTSAKNKALKEKYKERVENLKKQYNEAMEKSEVNEEALDSQILEERAALAEGKVDLRALRKEPIIKRLERTTKERKSVEKQLESVTDDAQRASLEVYLTELTSTEKRILESDAGKKYTQVVGGIDEAKNNIAKCKEVKKGIKEGRKNLDAELKAFMEKAKEELNVGKESNLPTKRSKIMMFIGGIRAKLGIGKHKAEKNAADSIQKALNSIGEFSSNVVSGAIKSGQAIGKGISNIAHSIGDFGRESAESVISKLEKHLKNRITTNQEKIQGINDRLDTNQDR